MNDPTLDFRTTDAFFQQTLALARAYTPEWTSSWSPADPDPADVDRDPGLVQLKLFSLLARYMGQIQNQIPRQRQLAFYQFLNLDLRPPLPAQAPISVVLQPGHPAFLMPMDSAVLDAPDQQVRFQTNEPLQVMPATLSAVLTIIPAQDRYINVLDQLRAGAAAPLFLASQNDSHELPLSHWLLLGDAGLFKPDPSLQRVRIELTGARLQPEYFQRWFDGERRPLPATITEAEGGLGLCIEIDHTPDAAARTVTQLQAALYAADGRSEGLDVTTTAQDLPELYWLLAQPAPLIRVVASARGQLPVITGMRCTVSGEGIAPQQAACETGGAGAVQINIRNGAWPFGQTPALEDAFYLRSDSVFSRQGGQITLDFELGTVAVAYPVSLLWQFWDGTTWRSMNATPADVATYGFVDTTDNLRRPASTGPTWIRFLCPDIQPTTVAGAEGRWIRAVLGAGGYGALGGITTQGVAATLDAVPVDILPLADRLALIDYLNDVEGVNFSYSYTPSSYAPPYIQALRLSHAYTSVPTSPWTCNAFTLEQLRFRPYRPVADTFTASHIGFEPDAFARATVGGTLTLYLQLASEDQHAGTALPWSYYTGQHWRPLDVDDGTMGLTRSGIVKIVIPADLRAATLYAQRACWLRIENPRPHQDVIVLGIHPNTVMAGNRCSVIAEILGSSNEQPQQRFQLGHWPVLAGMELDVAEPTGMDPDASTSTEALPLALPAPMTAQQTRQAREATLLRRWQQVDTFSFSGPSARVYMLDTAKGVVLFGDGRNGRIPPRGYNNIIASQYHYTQGQSGNLPAGTLTVLRPGDDAVAAVYNPSAAQGGVNGDSIDDLTRAAPAQVKANDRGVQWRDLDSLARSASPAVCRAHAQPGADGRIQVAVLALDAQPRPQASPALLETVRGYLRARCLATLAARIDCTPPRYVPIDVVAQVVATCDDDQRTTMQQALTRQLQAVLHPVYGGPDGQGWAFGQAVQSAQLSALLRRDPRIVAVAAMTLNGQHDGSVTLRGKELPVAGDIVVLIRPAMPATAVPTTPGAQHGL